jgi:putative addiction module component (TIGR02574 family)
MKDLKTLTEEALVLPAEERARLAESLLDSLEQLTEEEIERLWAREAVRRLQAYERGQVQAHPAAEVHEEIRRRLK